MQTSGPFLVQQVIPSDQGLCHTFVTSSLAREWTRYLSGPFLVLRIDLPEERLQLRGTTMKWITRERPKTDRIACPWLIKRFIDHEAEIIFVLADQVLLEAERLKATSFDAPGATYTHRGNKCTFEVLIDDYKLGGEPALTRLAKIVHAADISDDLNTDPLGPGLLAIGIGGLYVETDDQRLLEKGEFVYDALYAWCQH